MEERKKKGLVESLVTRGVENIVPGREYLEEQLWSGKKLKVYMGIDPTATRIHLGHAFPLRKLQILADLGHEVIFLVGDFTARVGDTSDKETERPVLTTEQIEENVLTYRRQASKFLDFSRVKFVYNSEWLSALSFGDVLKLAQHFSLNDFIGRELIKKRLDEGKRVSLPETLYPIMQGYDSYHLDSDLQLGGTDQIFNMQAGRSLQKALRGKESCVLANGFLPGTDGRKMSKTWGNAIWLEDSPEEVYGKVMSLRDDMIETYLWMGTNLEESAIQILMDRMGKGENPMKIKKELAKQIVAELCGKDLVGQAEESFHKTVVNKQADDNSPVYQVRTANIGVVHDLNGEFGLANILVDLGLVSSRAEFKRLLDEGGVYLDEKRLEKEKEKIELHDGMNIIRVGKRKYVKLERS